MSEAQARQAEQHFAETARAEGLGFLDKDRDRGNTFAIHRLLHERGATGPDSACAVPQR
jgi:hypothetical protein